MNKEDIQENRMKLLNFVPLPEDLQEVVKVRKTKPKEKKPYQPRPGTITYNVLEILNNCKDDYLSIVDICYRLTLEPYYMNVDRKNMLTLLYNMWKSDIIRKHPYSKGYYGAIPPATTESGA